jgi:glycosyltransferase involved in cell wall biosynthesis
MSTRGKALPMPALSIVIPTRDRVERLARTLTAILSDPCVETLEVVVVNDGSSDGTRELLDSERFGDRLRSVELPGRGPATARNRGIELARAPRVLLLGDDTRPGQATLEIHRDQGDCGLQGFIEWEPSEEVTDVMAFLAPAGPQFYFEGLVDGAPVPYTAVLGSNLSAPTVWFLEEPFDESFSAAAFEDTELAYRWRRRGHRVLFSRSALCFHAHRYETLEPFLQKQRAAGAAARRAVRHHPGMLLDVVARPLVVDGWNLLASPWRRLTGTWTPERERWRECRSAFWRGFREIA